jgi:large subunit ribosomal protein L25
MLNRTLLKASRRSKVGKTAVKQSRRSGFVPGVLYGTGEPQPIELKAIDLVKVLQTFAAENILVNLEVEEKGQTKNRLALLQDIQHDPIRDTIVHVDFHELDENKKMHTEIPIIHVGEPVGVRTGGGLLDHVMRTLKVECLPKDLPTHIEVDITNLEVNQSIHVSDIKAPQGVHILNPQELIVFVVHIPTVVEEPTAAAATTEVTQPEVIKEKKTEEGAAPAAEAPKAEKGKAEKK